MSGPSTTGDLFRRLRDPLSLEWVAGRNGETRSLRGTFPGAASTPTGSR